MQASTKIAVKAIILNEHGEMLIMQRSAAESLDAELWDLPGGRLATDETKEQGLLREVKEETGLEIEMVTLANIWTYTPDEHTIIKGYTYLCKYIGGNITLSAEHSTYQWVQPAQFANYPAHPNLYAEINKVFSL